MRIVSIGDLVVDYYYSEEKIIGLSGGMTCHNVIANLSSFGIKTAVLGVCGKDNIGRVATRSLSQLGVDIKKVIKEPVKTRSFHVSFDNRNGQIELISRKRCPICNEKDFYDNSKVNIDYLKKNIRKTDVLVIDNINELSAKVMSEFDNQIILDLGQFYDIENLSSEELVNIIRNNVTILQLNNRMLNYFNNKFKIDTELELYKKLNPKLLIITKGKDGADFIYNNKVISKKNTQYFEEKDPSGAGDAFLACAVYSWIKNNQKISIKMINEAFELSTSVIEKVVSNIGARAHLLPLYEIKKISGICTCKNFKIKSNIKRYKLNINNLRKRVLSSCADNIFLTFKDKMSTINGPSLFIGTGGSYAAAYFSSRVYNEMKREISVSTYPRNALYQKNDKYKNVICFSYSGTTNDIITMTKRIEIPNKYLITKGTKSDVEKKTLVYDSNIITYGSINNSGTDKGFLSFDGALSPSSLFFREYAEKNDIDYFEFINSSFDNWDAYFNEKLGKKINVIKNAYKNKINVSIFMGDNISSGVYDLESKIIESGSFNVTLHEKKNFSHGRFINFENLGPNMSIFFGQENLTEYETMLMNYLTKKSDLFIPIISRYNGILADFDLLIASQLFIGYIGDAIDVDVSKPKYSEESMNFYFFKGDF